jgi:HAD superfamily phosphoserine phosphatase-like hydrolase
MTTIAIAAAKEQLERMSVVLESPLLLIGGLAVNQYILTRKSEDIDLVCEHEVARNLIDKLYPMTLWTHTDKNGDDSRPSFWLKHKHDVSYPVVKLGPKFVERGAYRFINWEALHEEAAPFRLKHQTLDKILVPTAEALCYTKLISFLGRSRDIRGKLRQDLDDIRKLTSLDEFRMGVFLNFINRNQLGPELESAFHTRLNHIEESLDESNLGMLVKLFSKAVAIGSTARVRASGRTVTESPEKVAAKSGIRLAAFDLDGTLIKGIRHSWTVAWNAVGVDSNAPNGSQRKRKKDFANRRLSYIEWCRQDAEELAQCGLTRTHFTDIVRQGICALTRNATDALKKLREAGVKTAVISGGIDTLLYALLPDADELFDEILINRFTFSPDGKLESVSPTEYDWDEEKVGVVGKRRGLERICERLGIPVSAAAFIGDDRNDFSAMKAAGLKIFYCGDRREFKGALPADMVIISENDLLRVADCILSPPEGELADFGTDCTQA